MKLLDVEEEDKTNRSMKSTGQEKRLLKKLSMEYGKESSNKTRQKETPSNKDGLK